MRRTEYLINALRRSTDNVQTAAIEDAELIEYYNDGQKLIQNLVFKYNPKADIFKGVEVYDATADGVYDLPEDIYAVNAISLVEATTGLWDDTDNEGYVKIDRVDEDCRSYLAGYFIRDNQLIFTGSNQNYQFVKVRLTYFKKLPRMDKRWGTIQTVNSGVSLVLSGGYDDLGETVDDYVTVVNSVGEIVRDGIRISSFSGSTWNTTDALTGVTAGQYVCMGEYSQNVSLLPDECEPYLQDYVRKRLYGRNNYNDVNKQDVFTAEQKDELVKLFSNNTKEVMNPPITDTTFLEF